MIRSATETASGEHPPPNVSLAASAVEVHSSYPGFEIPIDWPQTLDEAAVCLLLFPSLYCIDQLHVAPSAKCPSDWQTLNHEGEIEDLPTSDITEDRESSFKETCRKDR